MVLVLLPVSAAKADDVIEIGTYDELKAFAARVNGGENSLNAVLTADIVATDAGWSPIGIYDAYSGTFDGQGHSITGLIVTKSSSYTGMFQAINASGKVQNLMLIDASISGTGYAGGIAGRNHGTVQNCCVIGTVSGSGYNGGIVGNNQPSGVVQRCYYACEESHSINGGGVAGLNLGTVQYCYYDSDKVSASGAIASNSGTATSVEGLSTAHMTGTAASENMTGFEFGTVWFTTETYPSLEKPRFTVTVNNGTGGGEYALGSSVTITANEPEFGMVFAGWDGANELTFTDGDASTATATFTMPDRNVTVTALFERDANVIEIGTYDELKAFAERVNNGETSLSAVLTADIVATDTDFEPITSYDKYVGTFDGKGHAIEGLTVSGSSSYTGMFRRIGEGGKVQNLMLIDASISGSGYTAGIAGYNEGTVQNCCVIGTVSGSTYGGGIVGFNTSSGVVQRCYYACETSNTLENGGGVAGRNQGTVQYCYYDSDKISAYGAFRLNSGTATSVSGLSTAEMTGTAAAENMTGFAFGTVWFTTETYPSLQNSVSYIDENGVRQSCTEYTLLTGGDEVEILPGGWYVAKGTVSYPTGLVFNDDVNLILADGCVLTAGNGENDLGLNVTGGDYYGSNLTVYGQIGQTGTLTVSGRTGIRAKAFGVYGGRINTAESCEGSAISTDTATIVRGSVTVTGGYTGIYATQVIITGGNVSATGGTGYGILGILGITFSWTEPTDSIYSNSYWVRNDGTFTVQTGKVLRGDNGKTYAGTITDKVDELSGVTLTPALPVSYIDENGDTQSCEEYTLLTGSTAAETLPGGWYVAEGTISYPAGLTFTEDVNLILADGCVLTAGNGENDLGLNVTGGDYYGSNLTVYGQIGQTGTLTVSGRTGIRAKAFGVYGGRINTAESCEGSAISTDTATIVRGSVTVTGGYTGIYATQVIITGGNVSATGGTGYGILGILGITFSWTEPTDSIYSNSYWVRNDGTFTVQSGKCLLGDNGKTYVGTITDKIDELSGVTLTPAYAIHVTESEHGSVTADTEYAGAGETVTLTVAPDEGCLLASLTVKDAHNNDVTVTNNAFTMPASDVTVSAVFSGVIEIGTYEELKAFAERVNNDELSLCAVLTADIVATDTDFTPIGYYGEYIGVFDGRGHSIKGLTVSGSVYMGVFRRIGEGGTVQNLMIVNAAISGTSYAGGIAGTNKGTVQRCGVIGTVSGSGNYNGGIVGTNEGTVQDCYMIGTVSGSGAYSSGIVGINRRSGVVQRCYYACESSLTLEGGGVAGLNEGTVQNCYYDSDKVSASGAIANNSGTATNVSGLSTAEMTGTAAAENMTGFAFGTVWFTTATYPSLQAPETYTVQFVTDYYGWEIMTEVTVNDGETVAAPEDTPVQEGYVFDGWYEQDWTKNWEWDEGWYVQDVEDESCWHNLGTLIYDWTGEGADNYMRAWDFENDTVTQDTYLYAKWTAEPILPKFATHSLVLDGKIGVNFFMDLRGLSDQERIGTYMTFAISGAGSVSEEPIYFDEGQMNSDQLYFGFTCFVTSIQMADTITATFHYGDGQSVSETYSIAQYIETFEGVANQFDDKTVALVHALADYGHYVQLYLEGVKDWSLGSGDDQYAPMDTVYTTEYDAQAIAEAVADYGIVRDNNSADIEKITYSVRLDSDTAILVYFKPVKNYSGNFTVTLGGDPYTATPEGGRYVVEIPDIGAHLLGTTYEIVATTDNGTATVEVSALSYVKGMLAAYAGVTNAENAACAIYAYYAAASAYNQEH